MLLLLFQMTYYNNGDDHLCCLKTLDDQVKTYLL